MNIESIGLKLIASPLNVYKMFESAGEGVDLKSSIDAVCFDLNLRVITPNFNGTIGELFDKQIPQLRDEVSITEEEFYNIA